MKRTRSKTARPGGGAARKTTRAAPRKRATAGAAALDTHAFDEEVVLLILLNGVLRCKAMEVIVPDSVGNQLVPRGESVVGWVDEKLAWVHSVLWPVCIP